MALRNLLRVVRVASVNMVTRLPGQDRVGCPLPPGESGACHPVREGMLLGLCQLRFGALEATLYDTMMARIEGRQHTDPPASVS